MRNRIETRRLILRPFEEKDAFGWFGDPEVMRFTTTGPDTARPDEACGAQKQRLPRDQSVFRRAPRKVGWKWTRYRTFFLVRIGLNWQT